MQTIEGKSEREASQSCQVGESRMMLQKKPLHWTPDFGRTWQEEITSAQRMEGRVGKIRGWRLNLEKKPSQENGKMQNNWFKQKPLERQDNLVTIQRLRKKRVLKQSLSAQSSAIEKSKATSILRASPSSPATCPSPHVGFLLFSYWLSIPIV